MFGCPERLIISGSVGPATRGRSWSFGTDSNVNDALSVIAHIRVDQALAANCPRCPVGPQLRESDVG
jgi:hypothetical protein